MNKPAPIFSDEKLQRQFELNGYVVSPFFGIEELKKLQFLYEKLPRKDFVFESSSFLDDISLKHEINIQVSNIFQAKTDALFKDYKPLGTSFLTKKNGTDSVMPVHQDWTVVDEAKYTSVTCWIPLTDTNTDNGAIQLISGSHKFSSALRSPSLPIAFQDIYADLKPFLKTLHLKAGEAFIFNQALWHASHPNTSGKDRIAVTYGLTNKEAQLYMYYYRENNTLEKWAMPDDMFLHYPQIRHQPAIGTKLETFDYSVSKITEKEIAEKVVSHRKNTKMKPLFKNIEQQAFFEENGYIKLPALDADDIESLKTLYTTLGFKDEKGYGFHVGMDNKDKKVVSEMMHEIKRIALPKVQNYLEEVQLFTTSFVVKDPNPQGVVPPHQDWSFVEDEENYCSVTCWIPLQDVNIENGCMGVIKGSNHFFDAFRPSPSPQVGGAIKEHMFTIFPFLQLVEMKAGEALIFNNKTIHASPPNTTDETRLAVGLGFTQKEAKICHYYLKPGSTDKVLKYNIDADFFFKYDNALLSKMHDEGKLIEDYGEAEEKHYAFEKLTAEQLTQRIQDAGNVYNAPLVATMAKLFNYNADGSPKNQEKNEIVEVVGESNNGHSTEEILPFWKVYTPLNILREIKHRIA